MEEDLREIKLDASSIPKETRKGRLGKAVFVVQFLESVKLDVMTHT
jgi:hypothetical protein